MAQFTIERLNDTTSSMQTTYRKFKPPIFLTGDISLNRGACQSSESLVKIPMLLRLAWAVQRSEGHEVFQTAPLARTQSERLRRLALITGFGFSDCLE